MAPGLVAPAPPSESTHLRPAVASSLGLVHGKHSYRLVERDGVIIDWQQPQPLRGRSFTVGRQAGGCVL
jgi:hypothetical protein